jgi:serine/threonine protein kinase
LIGKTLAHYEITSMLGRGGMGEVYRARDTKLDRDVALKVLHEEVARDPERLARFRREAKVLASLNHPNIAALHGLEEVDGHVFLVMELVEGKDLSSRIEQGAVRVEEAVQIASDVARGLERAHEQGIVHRDLKPSNLMMTPEGEVKVLDFGLARIYSGDDTSSTDLENSPTITAAFTAAGVILGTAAYMSPEQARGKHVDRRTDIWAFGVVLWEMITGERLFAGETVSDTLAAVLTREVDPVSLPAHVPPSVRHLLARCLERDPRLRLRDIGEARLMLEHPEVLGPLPKTEVTPSGRRSRMPWLALPWLLLAAVLAIGLPRLISPQRGSDVRTRVRSFEITADLPQLYNTRAVEISPDGSRIVIFSRDGLLIRDIDRTDSRLLVPADQLDYTESGVTPFWSPDSRSVAYGARGRLWKVAADGGNPSVVCTLPGGWNGGAWGADDQIVFATSRGPMYSVNARGGDPVLLLPLDDGETLDFHQPAWVSDGGGFLYSVHRSTAVDTVELFRDGHRNILFRIEAEITGNVQLVNNVVYSPTGHILYQRDQGNRGLWAVSFDAERGDITGDPFLVRSEFGHPSVSADGTLISVALSEGGVGELLVVARYGTVKESLAGPVSGLQTPAVSPDGRRVAYAGQPEQTSDIFVIDRMTNLSSRLTLSEADEYGPAWTPDGQSIAYAAPGPQGCDGVWTMRADGAGEPGLLIEAGVEPSFGAEGRQVVFTTRCARERGIALLDLDSGGDPTILREDPSGIDSPQLSPDGRFIAYRSWETGAPNIVVADFPSMSGRRIVARTESVYRWSADSSEFYYVLQGPNRLVVASVDSGPAFNVRSTEILFELAPLDIPAYGGFDVDSDGTEFFLVRQDLASTATRSFTLTENWFEAFRGQ